MHGVGREKVSIKQYPSLIQFYLSKHQFCDLMLFYMLVYLSDAPNLLSVIATLSPLVSPLTQRHNRISGLRLSALCA